VASVVGVPPRKSTRNLRVHENRVARNKQHRCCQ